MTILDYMGVLFFGLLMSGMGALTAGFFQLGLILVGGAGVVMLVMIIAFVGIVLALDDEKQLD